MASDTEIANLAISHLGSGKEILNLETERSAEALVCRRFFDTAREATLRDFPWPFATKFAALGLLTSSEDDTHPNDEWTYQYQYPSDCLKLRRLLSGTRNDSRQTRAPYKMAYGDSGQVLFTDLENASAEYTLRVDDPGRYPPDFVMALSLRLASYIAPRMTAGDPFKLGDRAMRFYEYEISKAKATSANEQQDEEEPDSEFIRERG